MCDVCREREKYLGVLSGTLLVSLDEVGLLSGEVVFSVLVVLVLRFDIEDLPWFLGVQGIM